MFLPSHNVGEVIDCYFGPSISGRYGKAIVREEEFELEPQADGDGSKDRIKEITIATLE